MVDDELSVPRSVPPSADHRDVGALLRAAGWESCGVGDWAIALRSPSGRHAARISPFDPAAPYTAELYRRAASTGQVPRLDLHVGLEGGAELTVMEFLEPVAQGEAVAMHRAIESRELVVARLVEHIDDVHALGARELPWWGPVDDNPANVMRAADGRVVVTDLFYADGPGLFATVLSDPDRVARAIPPAARRFMFELPLSSSGGWDADALQAMRGGLAAADAALGLEGRG
ncbi:hypothetical protein [Curtobacterium sp. Leaf261]|uniref:hypothetical protein n=1 Tax=Curtobacterium sp. Leaf261 TaxID=1736311 RepID=UPI0006F6FBE3|nr:hypothetical protein [Curtobacterium sp. Leaf261]KQO59738.1 hypothetical protein ASF23_15725 [Curtobacterium sp. Leaf261]